MKWMIRIVVLIVVLAAVGGGLWWYLGGSSKVEHKYRTDKIERGDVVATIGATGTIEPESVIDVGAQVNGTVKFFGTDVNGRPVDYNAVVGPNMLLAQIDDVTYRADVTEAAATLEQSKAGVLKAEADLATANAKLYQAQRDWERAEKIGTGDALAQTTYDNYHSTYEQAIAAVATANAAVAQAKATVDQSESALSRANRNLDYCTIKSPVGGTIIQRRVNIGQTVVSNLSASSLFLLAKDLKKMQIWVAVNEADIGDIKPGQSVTFTVDALKGASFKGVVNRIRLDASMTQNVVTYTVEVNVANDELKLLPYMTANVLFEVSRHESVLTVANAALRWTPSPDQVIPSERKEGDSPNFGPPGENSTGEMKPTTAPARDPNNHPATLWVKDGDLLKPLHISAGATDGVVTEVRGEELKEELEVVTGEIIGGGDAAAGANPLSAAVPPGHRRRRRGPPLIDSLTGPPIAAMSRVQLGASINIRAVKRTAA